MECLVKSILGCSIADFWDWQRDGDCVGHRQYEQLLS